MYVHSEEKIHGCVNGVSQCLQTCLGAKRHALRLCKYVSASPFGSGSGISLRRSVHVQNELCVLTVV